MMGLSIVQQRTRPAGIREFASLCPGSAGLHVAGSAHGARSRSTTVILPAAPNPCRRPRMTANRLLDRDGSPWYAIRLAFFDYCPAIFARSQASPLIGPLSVPYQSPYAFTALRQCALAIALLLRRGGGRQGTIVTLRIAVPGLPRIGGGPPGRPARARAGRAQNRSNRCRHPPPAWRPI
jgi:hypothetical protein